MPCATNNAVTIAYSWGDAFAISLANTWGVLMSCMDLCGALQTVPVGYWRNFLLPNGMAKIASEGILE